MSNPLIGSRKIYIDANVLIYLVEGSAAFQEKAERVFAYANENRIPILSSEILVAECLYGAHRLGRPELAEKYRWIFRESEMIHLVPIDIGIHEAAAIVGSQNRLKLIDAIHFATAIDINCDAFVTNDKGIRPTDSLRVVPLSLL